NLTRSRAIGDHQLKGIAIPSAVGGVLMVIIGDREAEVQVVFGPDNLHRRALIIRTRPNATAVWLEKNVVRAGQRGRGALWHRELEIIERWHVSPIGKVSIDCHRDNAMD